MFFLECSCRCVDCVYYVYTAFNVRAVAILIFFNQHECEVTSEVLPYFSNTGMVLFTVLMVRVVETPPSSFLFFSALRRQTNWNLIKYML